MSGERREKVRTQWQDGVGNIQIWEIETESKTSSLSRIEVNWIWLVGVAAIVFIIIFSLCLIARCKLTLKSPRKNRKKSIVKKNSTSAKPSKKEDSKPPSGETGVTTATKKSDEKSSDVDVEKGKDVQAKTTETSVDEKTKLILSEIDSLLEQTSSPGELGNSIAIHSPSLDSLDAMEDYRLVRKNSNVSLDLSLVMDNDHSQPVFKYPKSNKRR